MRTDPESHRVGSLLVALQFSLIAALIALATPAFASGRAPAGAWLLALGGLLLVGRDETLVARARVLALHGMSKDAWHRFGDKGYKHYQVVECGFKYNMMDLQAAIGIHQLARVESTWQRRADIWARYQKAFADLPAGRPAEPAAGTKHAYHLYTLQIDADRDGISRDAFLDGMNVLGIGTGVHYLSLAEHPYYQQRFGWTP